MRVLTQVPPEYTESVRRRFPNLEIIEVPMSGPIGHDVYGDVLFTWTRGSKNLEQILARGVKWIHVLGTGVDEFPFDVLDGQVLTCARGAAAVPIAEWALTMMLTFEKKVPEQWVTEPPEQWLWASLGTLAGRRLAIVGFGSIGRQVASRALSFGMHVRAIRRTNTPVADLDVDIVGSLEDLLTDAHHIVLAAPATPATDHLFDKKTFSLVTPGAHLVNIARGSLVDQDALRVGLDEGRIARASLDTTTPEPLPHGHWMYKHRSVRLSPHVSWSHPDALEITVATFGDNLERWMSGQPLDGIVDVAERY